MGIATLDDPIYYWAASFGSQGGVSAKLLGSLVSILRSVRGRGQVPLWIYVCACPTAFMSVDLEAMVHGRPPRTTW